MRLKVELGRKEQLLDTDLLIYWVTYLKCCLFANSDVTCYQEQNDLEEQLKQWVVALNNLLMATYTPVKTALLCGVRAQNESGSWD